MTPRAGWPFITRCQMNLHYRIFVVRNRAGTVKLIGYGERHTPSFDRGKIAEDFTNTKESK